MATLDAETGSRGSTWRVRFLAADNRRVTIRLGKIPKRTAESPKVRIELLVAARIAGHSIDAKTALWVSSLSDGIHARLVNSGLAAPRDDVVVPEKTIVRLGDKIDAVLGDLHDAACREPNHDSPLAQQIHSLEDWCREPRDLLRLLRREPLPPRVKGGDRHALAIAELGHRHA